MRIHDIVTHKDEQTREVKAWAVAYEDGSCRWSDSLAEVLVPYLDQLNDDLAVEIDLHHGRTEMARNIRLAIIETELELEGLKS